MSTNASNIVIVLNQPQNPSNIGAVVRAMLNMGFSSLRLVNPKPFERGQLLRVAHRSEDLIDTMQIYTSLDEALADVTYVVGASMQGTVGKPFTNDIETMSGELVKRSQSAPVALLFGTEKDGLDLFAMDRCHLVASLPVNPTYSSLNLAQAVLIFLYELRRVAHADAGSAAHAPIETTTQPYPMPKGSTPGALAPQAELQRLFEMSEEMLHRASFFRYNPTFVLRKVRDLIFRAQPTEDETAMLMSIVRRLLYVLNEPDQPDNEEQ
jgi:TrmH family RNA methyltransferase